MKTSHKPIDGFKPFEFTVEFETEAEANNFWHRLNCKASAIEESAKNGEYEYIENDTNNIYLFNGFDKCYRPKDK